MSILHMNDLLRVELAKNACRKPLQLLAFVSVLLLSNRSINATVPGDIELSLSAGLPSIARIGFNLIYKDYFGMLAGYGYTYDLKDEVVFGAFGGIRFRPRDCLRIGNGLHVIRKGKLDIMTGRFRDYALPTFSVRYLRKLHDDSQACFLEVQTDFGLREYARIPYGLQMGYTYRIRTSNFL